MSRPYPYVTVLAVDVICDDCGTTIHAGDHALATADHTYQHADPDCPMTPERQAAIDRALQQLLDAIPGAVVVPHPKDLPEA